MKIKVIYLFFVLTVSSSLQAWDLDSVRELLDNEQYEQALTALGTLESGFDYETIILEGDALSGLGYHIDAAECYKRGLYLMEEDFEYFADAVGRGRLGLERAGSLVTDSTPRYDFPAETLYDACLRGNYSLAEKLIAEGADLSSSEFLEIALKSGNDEIAMLLIENGSSTRPRSGVTMLMSACGGGSLRAMKYFVENGADVNYREPTYGYPTLTMAFPGSDYGFNFSKEKSAEMMMYLIEHGADVDAARFGNTTPLMWASNAGCADLVRFLVEHGADVNHHDEIFSALKNACSIGHAEIAGYLLDQGAEIVNLNDESPLLKALSAYVPYDFYQGFEKRCKNPAEVEWIVRKLVENGARIEGLTYYGTPVIDFAERQGFVLSAVYLYRELHGSDPDFAAGLGDAVSASRWEISPDGGHQYAFDGLFRQGRQGSDWTKWVDAYGTPTSLDPSWIQIQYREEHVFNTVVLVSADDAPESDPEDFRIMALGDDGIWVTLGSWNDQHFSGRFETKQYAFENTEAYSCYKLEIIHNNGNVRNTQLAEIMLSNGSERRIPRPK